MNMWERLDHLLKYQVIGTEENDLVQKILKNYNLYSLTGHNKWALALLIARCIRDITQALDDYRAKHRPQ